jgi:hypothetical protein
MPKFSEFQQVVQVAELPYAETYTFDGAWANYAMADNTRSWMPPGSKQGTYPHATINGSRWDNKQRLVEFHVTKPFGGSLETALTTTSQWTSTETLRSRTLMPAESDSSIRRRSPMQPVT